MSHWEWGQIMEDFMKILNSNSQLFLEPGDKWLESIKTTMDQLVYKVGPTGDGGHRRAQEEDVRM